MRTLLILPFASVLTLLHAPAQEPSEAAPPAKTWISTDAYPLDTCVVSGRPFYGIDMQVVEAEGRTFKLCSADCAAKLRKDPAAFAAKLDQAVMDAQLADYPLIRCPISGRKLGATGEPAKLVLDNHLVQLCCEQCADKAKAKKGRIVADIEAAAFAAQKDSYPLKTCLTSGEDLDPETTVDVMHGPTLLRFSCENCIEDAGARARDDAGDAGASAQ